MLYNPRSGPSPGTLPVFKDISMRKADPASIPLADEAGLVKAGKYREIIDFYETAIQQGVYREGQKLPTEVEIAKQFHLSRPTVSKAMREMQLAGLVERRIGSGSYVRRLKKSNKRVVLGLLIPNIGDREIFESVAAHIAREAQSLGYDLVLPRLLNDRRKLVASTVCEPYLAKEVAGVFFAPLELNDEQDAINHEISAIFNAAGRPVVLLDRDLEPYPARSAYDLVGIDNRGAGYLLGQHLIDCGCKSIAYIAHPLSASTVHARSVGILGALTSAGQRPAHGFGYLIDPTDLAQVKSMLSSAKPDGIVCANDQTAAELMQTLDLLGVRIPQDISVVGIDDVRYARMLRPALTTIHQPCDRLGIAALQTMLGRIAEPNLPARHVTLSVEIVVRQSTKPRVGTR